MSGGMCIQCLAPGIGSTSSDVLGRASSPEPAKPSPSKGLQWAQAWLQILEAQAWALTPCGLVRDPQLEV